MVKDGERFNLSCWPLVSLRRVQGDDKFAPEGRVVLDSNFLEHLARNTYVTQVNPAGALTQGKREAKREGPLGFNCLTLSTHWGV